MQILSHPPVRNYHESETEGSNIPQIDKNGEPKGLQRRPFLAILAPFNKGVSMFKKKLLGLLTSLLILTSCAKETGVTYTPPPLADEWVVTMVQSGGIMGLQRSIRISSDGKYTVVDEMNGKSVNSELSAENLDGLKNLVADFSFTAPKAPMVCADCFIYKVAIQSGGQKMVAEIDDVNMPETGMGPLVEFLRDLMDSALK